MHGGSVPGAQVLMRRPCSVPECVHFANAAGVYCDGCDEKGMSKNWSQSRDDAWLAYIDCEGIRLLPLPNGTDYEAVQNRLRGSRPL